METRIFQAMRVNMWAHNTAPVVDLPVTTPGDALRGLGPSGVGLGFNEYGKAAFGYLALKDLPGDTTFRKCLHAYMARWHGKHPGPWNFFYTFLDAGETVVARPVRPARAMTATPVELPEALLKQLREKILALPGVSGLLLDVTSKPPGTIEWE
jgi:hypothetical protein